MSRLLKLTKMPSHPMLGKLFKKLNQEEHELVAKFVFDNEELSDDEYMFKANRWYMDQAKPKHYNDMWAIVTQCVEFKPKSRRE